MKNEAGLEICEKAHTVFLTRRNLLTLLSKLDRAARGEETNCTIIKGDYKHRVYPQDVRSLVVRAVEDKEYYQDRNPGSVNPLDDPQYAPKKN